jgi:hypothetical protein
MSEERRLEQIVGLPLPDITLSADDGRPFALRQHAGVRPLALFFYLHNGTPG